MTRTLFRSFVFCAPLMMAALAINPARAETFSYIGATQTCAVSNTGLYNMAVYGAAGGRGNSLVQRRTWR